MRMDWLINSKNHVKVPYHMGFLFIVSTEPFKRPKGCEKVATFSFLIHSSARPLHVHYVAQDALQLLYVTSCDSFKQFPTQQYPTLLPAYNAVKVYQA